jgi:hypothetical protein
MRVLALSLLLVTISAVGGKAQTYDPRYPVCMKVYQGAVDGGEWIDCSYTSMPQCRASASGRAAMCDPNPYFAQSLKRAPGTVPRGRQPY